MRRWVRVHKAQVSWFLLHQVDFRCFQTLLICTTRVGSHAVFAEVSGNANISGEPHGEGWFALVAQALLVGHEYTSSV